MQDGQKLKEYRGKVQVKADEICRLILDGENSLTHWLVKATRAGLNPDVARNAVYDALVKCINDALVTYNAAIAQPEPRISTQSRVRL